MSLITILETLLIGPLKLIFEIIFVVANRITGHPGLAIIALSLIMNILVLPLYRRADAMQEEARDIDAKLHDGVAHIKKTFSGDERMMILQTYYRQNNYKPTDALNGSASLLLEVPFFMAAYQFLSHLTLLQEVSFGPIADLSQPDGLIVIGGIAINFLPILMTLVNVISSAVYLKGFPLKTKIQLYGMAAFFLVFLYTSPSGLVFYWTLNNLFSLVKTIFYKLKDAKKVGRILLSVAGIGAVIWGVNINAAEFPDRRIALLCLGILMQIPMVLSLLKLKNHVFVKHHENQPDSQLFLLCGLFMTVLIGLLIPSTFIAASPQEFVDPSYFHNPLLYILSSTCMAAGTFLVWMRVFYWLAGSKGKATFDKVAWILCGVMIVNYMFFGTDLGVISSDLQYESGLKFTHNEYLANSLILLILVFCLFFAALKLERKIKAGLLVAVVVLSGMSALNIGKIKASLNDIVSTATDTEDSLFRLSKTGKNVVVLMLDRSLGQLVPFIFNEKPELQEQFDGFTFYKNTISHGGCTNFGVPGLMGGYEYTPVEMNSRANESLREKHNEALKVMPVMFLEEGYEVTVCDPPYANYEWIPDLTIYDDYPEIDTHITYCAYVDNMTKQESINALYRNFFCFSIMKTMPLAVQHSIYFEGNYNQVNSNGGTQIQTDISTANGWNIAFMGGYSVLEKLPILSEIAEEEVNTFLFLANNTTHEPMLLQTPDYVPAEIVNNEKYDKEHADRFVLEGTTLHVDNPDTMSHYHANMAAFIQLGKWFDYLRANDVYDNTRIIIVSDHGRYLAMDNEMITPIKTSDEDNPFSNFDIGFVYPTLLVKDFGSEGFYISSEFMTNADTPVLAVQGLIDKPVNPFTGNAITSDEKYNHDQFIILSEQWETTINNGNQFLPAVWASVKDNIFDLENWTTYGELNVLDKHSAY